MYVPIYVSISVSLCHLPIYHHLLHILLLKPVLQLQPSYHKSDYILECLANPFAVGPFMLLLFFSSVSFETLSFQYVLYTHPLCSYITLSELSQHLILCRTYHCLICPSPPLGLMLSSCLPPVLST